MIKHIITNEDLEMNPGLEDAGVQEGDEVELPETEEEEEAAEVAPDEVLAQVDLSKSLL